MSWHAPRPTGPAIIDLTLPVRPGMSVYPGDPAVVFEPVSSAGPEAYAVTALSLGTHTGTHVDALAHVLPDGDDVGAVPLDALIGPARIVDCTGLSQITLPALKRRAGEVAAGSRLLLRTEWDMAFGTPRYYDDFPGLTLPAVRWLVDRGILLLGLETPSVCLADDHAAHALLLGAGVVIVEGLAGLRWVRAETCFFAALPLRLVGLDGSPVRAVAWECSPDARPFAIPP